MPLAENRGPVATYEQALMWLVKLWADQWATKLDAPELPPEAQLVADLFWVTEVSLRLALMRRCRELDRAAQSPAPRRRYGGVSWTRP